MSRRLGKLICDNVGASSSFSSCVVKYVPSSSQFWFKFKGKGLGMWKNGHTIKMDVHLVYDIVSIRVGGVGSADFLYEWSNGYKVRPLVTDWRKLREAELEWLGGRKELLSSGRIESDLDFDEFCVICHLFCVSRSLLERISGDGSRCRGFVELKKRMSGSSRV